MKLFCLALGLQWERGVIQKDIKKRFRLNKLSKLQGVFDLKNDLYALWSHSKHHRVFLGFASFQMSVYICAYLFVCVLLKPSTDFLCAAPEIEASPVDEPELRFLGSCVGC